MDGNTASKDTILFTDMIDVGFIGDLHLGHPAIAKTRGFDDIDEYHEYVIKQYNSVLHARSLVFIVGDITFESPKYYPLLNRLLGRKIVALGNHDLPKDVRELLKYVESVAGAIKYKGNIITHFPLHVQEVSRFRINIHAHLHEDIIHKLEYMPMQVQVNRYDDPRYACVSWEQLKGVPISLENILLTKGII